MALRVLLGALGTAVAAGVLWLGVSTHLQRACWQMDTPYLPLCDGPPAANIPQELRAHLAHEPGDSGAWIRLTNLEPGVHEDALLRAAIALAPNEPNVQMWRAGQALSQNRLVEATALLVGLIEYRGAHRGASEAAKVLARMVASGVGVALLRPYLGSAKRWLPQVLGSVEALKLPLTAALPLLAEAAAKNGVPQQTARNYVAALKREGQWADAYSLWLSQQGKASSVLHNGSFDDRFEPDGFDWEAAPVPASRAGAVVNQRTSSNDAGQILDIQFTGRTILVPMIRQYLFIAPGKYVVRGRFMSSNLRTEQGLAWAVRCSSKGNALAGRSDGLRDTGGKWQTFQFAITVPSDCGLVASLQLETFAAFEAVAGFRGKAAFDALDLRTLPL